MGIYAPSGVTLRQTRPPVTRQIVVALFVIVDINNPPDNLQVRINLFPEDRLAAKFDIGKVVTQKMEGATQSTMVMVFNLDRITFEQDGGLEVVVEIDGNTVRAGRLAVRFVEPSQSG